MKLAILVDAENISHRYINLIIDEAARIGRVVNRRIYGDWSSQYLLQWRQTIQDYSFLPVQQFASVYGKNASDSAMIIDAMDLLHAGSLQGFIIVSSDSDFTRLAARLRESEKYVVGMGEQKTPSAFINACDRYIYLDVLMKEREEKESPTLAKATHPYDTSAIDRSETTRIQTNKDDFQEGKGSGINREEIINTIHSIISDNPDEEGWMFLGSLGNQLLRKYPDFDARNFGFSKLSEFIESLGFYEFKSIPSQTNPLTKAMYIRVHNDEKHPNCSD